MTERNERKIAAISSSWDSGTEVRKITTRFNKDGT